MFTFQQLEGAEFSPQSVGWGDLERCLATIEVMTPETGWALGSRFSAADVVFGGMLDFAMQFGWLASPRAKVAGYVRWVKDRPANRQSHDPSWY